MFKKIIFFALALGSFCATAQIYGGVGIASIKLNNKISAATPEMSTTALRALFGYKVSPKFSIEGLAATALSSSTIAPNAKVNIDHVLGIYAKPTIKITPEVEGFIRIGYVQTKASIYFNGEQLDIATQNGFSYGLGMNYELGKTTFLNLDYMFYINNNELKTSGFTAGLDYQF